MFTFKQLLKRALKNCESQHLSDCQQFFFFILFLATHLLIPQSQKSEEEEEEEGCETFLLNNSQLTLLKLLETRFV